MNMQQEMSYGQTPEQQIRQVERFDKAPVLYSLDEERIPNFLQQIQETLTDKPQAKTTVFITGESGAGKELVAGQLIHEILETNPDTEIGFISLGMAIKAARNPETVAKYADRYGTQLITRPGVDYNKDDYENASKMMHALIEEFYAQEAGKPKLAVVETVGYTYPTYDHGSSTVQRQMKLAKQDGFTHRNVFVIGLVADDKVQDATFISRNAAIEGTPEEVNEIYKAQGLRRDRLFNTPEDLDKFRTTRGTASARQRNRFVINEIIVNTQNYLIKMSYFQDEAAEAIRKNNGQLTNDMLEEESIRKAAHKAHATRLINEVWAIEPPQHGIVAENDFLDLPNIPYYVSLTQKYALVS